MTFFTVGNDFTISTSQLVFDQFSGGGIRGLLISAVLDSVSEGGETILLEASSGDWPFSIGGNSTTVTINECSAGTYNYICDKQLAKFNIIDYFYAENLFYVPYVISVSEGSGSLTTYVQLASGVGTLTEDLIVNISTSSSFGSYDAIGITK